MSYTKPEPRPIQQHRAAPDQKRAKTFAVERLQPLRGAVQEVRFTTCDMEATQWSKIYAFGFYDPDGGGPDGDGFYRFEGKSCARDFLIFYLQPKYAGVRCYAHNGGNYDFLFFLTTIVHELRAQGWEAEFTMLQSCAYMITLKNDELYPGQLWQFVDSFRLMPISLDRLGETFGVGRKVKIEVDKRPGESKWDALARPEHRAIMWKYNKQDCMVLYRALQAMQRILNGLGANMATTAPSVAMDLFRRRFLQADVYVNRHLEPCKELRLPPPFSPQIPIMSPYVGGKKALMPGKRYRIFPAAQGSKLPSRIDEVPDDEIVCTGCGHDFLRPFLMGGRTEVFRMRTQPDEHLRYFDINSHYPHCMLEKMPIGRATVFERGESDSEEMIWRRAKSLIGFIHCKVFVPPACLIPPLPLPMDGKLKFPTGDFEGHWTTAELENLRTVGGRIVEVYRQVWFTAGNLFNDYIAELYAFRQKDHPEYSEGLAFIAKLLMNSLFGKFGTKEQRERIVAMGLYAAAEAGLEPFDNECGLYKEKVTISPDYLCPQISAYITSLARARLWKILRWVGDNGGRVFYCDTDSVVCDIDLPAHLIGKQLGQLKLEHRIAYGEFSRPKLYLIECEGVKEVHEAWQAKGRAGIERLAATSSDTLCPCFFEWWGKAKKADRIVFAHEPNAEDDVVELWQGYHIRNKGFSKGLDGGAMDLSEWRRLHSRGDVFADRSLSSRRFAKLRTLANSECQDPRVTTTRKMMRSEYDKRIVCDDGIDTRPIVLQADPGKTVGKFRDSAPRVDGGVTAKRRHRKARTWPKADGRSSPGRKSSTRTRAK